LKVFYKVWINSKLGRLIFFLFLLEPISGLVQKEDKATAQSKWAAQGYFFGGYSPLAEINANYFTTSADLLSNFDFTDENIKQQKAVWGAEFDFLYQFNVPYIIGAGFAFTLDIPGELNLKRSSRQEFLNLSYSLASYLLVIKIGQEFYRGKQIFIRGFFEPRIGFGSLSILEEVSGADFGAARTNNTRLKSVAWGVGATLDVMWRLNIRNGVIFGLHADFLSYNNWRGNDPAGNPGRLVSVPLSSNSSEEVLKFLQDGREIPGDQKDAAFLVTVASFYIGYWQAL